MLQTNLMLGIYFFKDIYYSLKLNLIVKSIAKDFHLEDKKTIICTDASMCTDEIKQFNIKDGRAFVITQSIKN